MGGVGDNVVILRIFAEIPARKRCDEPCFFDGAQAGIHTQEVAGSNPASRTIKTSELRIKRFRAVTIWL